jgi:hypothetical protein
VQGSDQPTLAEKLQRTPYRHLGRAVMRGQLCLCGQSGANGKLTAPYARGKIVGKLHVDIFGSIPIRHMINVRRLLTNSDYGLLP